MCELRNSHYNMVFVKWRALIGLEAVSKSYSCIKKFTFWNGFVFGWNIVPLYGTNFNTIIDVYHGCRWNLLSRRAENGKEPDKENLCFIKNIGKRG
jgi:hypothetical protein